MPIPRTPAHDADEFRTKLRMLADSILVHRRNLPHLLGIGFDYAGSHAVATERILHSANQLAHFAVEILDDFEAISRGEN
jgi:hypothetical protein